MFYNKSIFRLSTTIFLETKVLFGWFQTWSGFQGNLHQRHITCLKQEVAIRAKAPAAYGK